MRAGIIAAGLALVGASAVADVRNEEFAVGDQLVQIEVCDPVEIMWVGPNQHERTQVLSGPDIEILAQLTDDQSVRMLGVHALVTVQPGTHTCENLGEPRAYHVVTLGENLGAEGPLTTCVELAVSATPGAIILDEDPMGDGEVWTWTPGRGFRATAE